MTSSRAKVFVPGKGYVGDAPSKSAQASEEFDGEAYFAERETAQMAKIAASMDRALGRTADLPGRRANRVLGLSGPTRTSSTYDPMRR